MWTRTRSRPSCMIRRTPPATGASSWPGPRRWRCRATTPTPGCWARTRPWTFDGGLVSKAADPGRGARTRLCAHARHDPPAALRRGPGPQRPDRLVGRRHGDACECGTSPTPSSTPIWRARARRLLACVGCYRLEGDGVAAVRDGSTATISPSWACRCWPVLAELRRAGVLTVMISGAAAVAGIAGQPIAHSLSPVIHNAWIAAAGLDARLCRLRAAGRRPASRPWSPPAAPAWFAG